MAASGEKSVSFTSWDSLVFSWWETSQSIANNTTTIGWKMELVATAYGKISASATCPWKVTVNGTEYSGDVNVGIGNNQTKTLASGTTTISHKADGSAEFSYSFEQYFGITFSGSWITTISGSGTGELTDIPRVSTLTGSNGTLGMSQKLVINRAADTLKHRITYNSGNSSGYVNGSTSFLTGDSYTWTPPLSLASENPTGTSVQVDLSLWTYAPDGTHIGTEVITLTYAIPASVIPSISQITVTDTTEYSEIYGQPVQGLSKLKIEVETTEAYGSEITESTISFNGSKFNTNPAETGVLRESGELTAYVTVKDQRGRTGSKEKTVWALAYAPPNVSSLTVHRCNADGTDNDKGHYIRVNFSATVTRMNGINTAAYELEYYPNGYPNDVTVVTFPELNNVYTVTDKAYIFEADENTSYSAKVIATDAHKTHIRSTNASTAFTLINHHPSGRGIAFGKVSEKEDAVEFGMDIYDKNNDPVYGWGDLVNMLLPVGTIVLRYDMKNPGTIYPGTTWTQIAARVLRAVGATGTVGEEGSIDSGGSGGRTYIDVAVWKRTA